MDSPARSVAGLAGVPGLSLAGGDAGRAPDFSERLRQQNILVSAIRPPTVPEESARLRITLSAAHKEEHVDRLLDALDKASQ